MASQPTTPVRRASSAETTSAYKSYARSRLSASRQDAIHSSTRKAAPATPYGKVARQRLEERRVAALTPGKNTRQSFRYHKDTPRDDLRLLSRKLAPGTSIIPSSPDALPNQARSVFEEADGYADDGFELKPPRLSLPPEEDDSVPRAPERTLLDDDNEVEPLSVEQPRRAVSEQPSRLYRGSFGSVRMSDAFDAPLDPLPFDMDETVNGTAQYSDYGLSGHDSSVLQEFTGTVRQSFGMRTAQGISPTASREGEAAYMQDVADASFALTIPGRESVLDTSAISAAFYDDAQGEEANGTVALESPTQSSSDKEPADEPEDVSLVDSSSGARGELREPQQVRKRPKKSIRVSKYGLQYPSLPLGVVKKLATSFMKTGGHGKAKLNKDTLGSNHAVLRLVLRTSQRRSRRLRPACWKKDY